MKLVANFSMLGAKPTGLGVYAMNCMGFLKSFRTTVISSGGRYPEASEVMFAPSAIAIGGGRVAAIRRQLWLRRLKFPGALVYSPTHHGLAKQDGQVITIHDLISLRFPGQHYPQYLYFKYMIPLLLKRCAAVFAVSEATRQDVAKTYGYPLDKIHVVPNAVDASEFVPGKVDQINPYLLMVGARYSHKNVEEVLRASHLWRDSFRLVVTSCSGSYRERLVALIGELGIESFVEFKDYVSRDELVRLYQGCAALIYPSKWEGFGIPPLEALACGRPVIASDIAPHREVLADGAVFVKLGEQASWEAAFSQIRDPSSNLARAEAGFRRVALYSKDNATRALEQSLLKVAPGIDRR